jgi:adenosylcobinamide-phosphate synthase
MDIIAMVAIALALDATLGEPPRPIHPVVWMGKVTSFLSERSAGNRPAVQFVYGVFITLFTIALFAVPAYFLLMYLRNLSMLAYIIVGAFMLKTSFSLKELFRAAKRMKSLLTKDELEKARYELRALVKRDTRDLPEPLVISATVESVAENIPDSFVAPLFYFLLFGVPGAIAYRVVNTLDAMIGYRGKYEYSGKFAARLDTVLNFIPARLSAFLIVLAAWLARRDGRNSWRITIDHHSKTASPNAGWPMSAMAGALNVQLEKRGHYILGEAKIPLRAATIDASLNLALIAAMVWSALCISAGVIKLACFA